MFEWKKKAASGVTVSELFHIYGKPYRERSVFTISTTVGAVWRRLGRCQSPLLTLFLEKRDTFPCVESFACLQFSLDLKNKKRLFSVLLITSAFRVHKLIANLQRSKFLSPQKKFAWKTHLVCHEIVKSTFKRIENAQLCGCRWLIPLTTVCDIH